MSVTNQLAVLAPSDLVRQSTDIAGLCREIVLKSAMEIQHRKYTRGCLTIRGSRGRIGGMTTTRKRWSEMTATQRKEYMRYVRSQPRRQINDAEILTRLMSRTKHSGECLEFQGSRDRLGYGKIRLRGRPFLAHRASFILHRGVIPEGMLVCHSCDNPSCINPAHLFLGDNLSNTMDAVRKGRKYIPDSRGEKHGGAKLTRAKVDEIRALSGKEPQSAIGVRFGISQTTVSRIVSRKGWK